MKKYSVIKITVYLLAASVFAGVVFAADTNAASCRSFLDGTTVWSDGTRLADRNPSLYNACTWNNGGSGIYGALWLNDSPEWNAISSTVTIGKNDKIKDIYLHGLIVGTNYPDTAKFIKITRGTGCMADDNCENGVNRIEYTNIDEWSRPSADGNFSNAPEYWSYAAIDGWGNDYTMNRPGFYYDSDIESTGVRGLKLDVEKLKHLELGSGMFSDKSYYGGTITYGSDTDTYKIPFQIFRCNGGATYINTDQCYSDTSWVKIDVPPSRYAGVAMALGTTDQTRSWSDYKNEGGWVANTKMWPEANDGDQIETYSIDDCSAEGCEFGFRFYLKSYEYGPTTKFRIFETDDASNLRKTPKKKWNDSPEYFDLTDNGGGPNYGGKQVYYFTGNLRPGQTKCGTIEYDDTDDHSKNSSTKLATVCVSAKGYLNEPINSSLNIEVKNDSIPDSDYGKYGKETYIKPSDNVTYRVVYDPAPQAVSSLVPNRMSINGGSTINNTGSASAVNLFNDNNSGRLAWSNAFQVYDGLLDGKNGGEYEVGNRNIQTKEYHLNSIDKKAGQKIISRARTDASDSSVTPTRAVVTKQDETIDKLDLYTGQINSEAAVHIPYNYRNEVNIDGPNGGVFYAGESMQVSFTPVVKGKYNSITGRYYATNVGESIVDGCVHVKGSSECLTKIDERAENENDKWNSRNIPGSNDPEHDEGLKQQRYDVDVNIPDMAAGGEVCMDVRIYPASSGSDDNYNDSEGDHSWSTNSKCFKVAKKPSFQVWGGDIYVGNGVADSDVPIAVKNLSGGTRVFGSWGELGVATNSGNGIMNLASGAGLAGGYNISAGNSYSFCNVSTLTFPSSACEGNAYTDDVVVGVGDEPYSEMIETIISRSGLDQSEALNWDDSGIYNITGNINIDGRQSIEGGKKIIIKASGDVNIKANINYKADSFSLLGDVPKVIIYARGSINIGCSDDNPVTNIDAILIANNNINTCKNDASENDNVVAAGGQNKKRYAHELRINGAMYAGGTIFFNRTYGAGPGNDSIVPGEIINYDPTWYVWNNGTTTSSSSSSENTITSNLMVPVYTRELAPRY